MCIRDSSSAAEWERRAVARWGFTFSGYRVRAWWYEAAEMVRKVMMVAGIQVVSPVGTLGQMAMGIVVSGAALVLHMHVQPFASHGDNFLQELSLLSVVMSLFAAVLLHVQSVDDSSSGGSINNNNGGGEYDYVGSGDDGGSGGGGDDGGIGWVLLTLHFGMLAAVVVPILKDLAEESSNFLDLVMRDMDGDDNDATEEKAVLDE